MKPIAFVTELYAPSLGGQEFRFERFAESLVAQGIPVDVYTVDHVGKLPLEETLHGVRVARYLSASQFVRPGSRRLLDLARYVRATSRLLKELRGSYEAIWMNQMPVAHLLVPPAIEECIIDWCEVPPAGLLRRASALGARRFRWGSAVSADIATAVQSLNPQARIHPLHTPIDLEHLDCDPAHKDRNLLVYMGRIVPHKNLEPLIQAVVQLNQDHAQHLELKVVGEGPLRGELVGRYSRFPYIEFLGRVDEREKTALFQRSGLFAQPSLREGFPNSVAEALAARTPILTVEAPLNGTRQFVREHDIGVVSRSPKAGDIRNAILQVLDGGWDRYVANTDLVRGLFDRDRAIQEFMGMVREVSGSPREETFAVPAKSSAQQGGLAS